MFTRDNHPVVCDREIENWKVWAEPLAIWKTARLKPLTTLQTIFKSYADISTQLEPMNVKMQQDIFSLQNEIWARPAHQKINGFE